MANQTANREPNRQEGRQLALPANNSHFYRGALVAYNGTNDYAVKAADTSGHKVAGVVAGEVDNTSLSAGAGRVEVYREGVFEFNTTGTAPKCGDKVYVSDDQTVAVAGTTTNDVPVGVVVEIPEAGKARVQIDVAVKGAL